MNNRQHEILEQLLANPADAGQLYNHNLHQLVGTYPQSGILRAMLAHSGTEDDLKHAAVYFTPALLHKLTHDPDAFPSLSARQVIDQTGGKIVIAPDNEEYAQNYFNSGPVETLSHEETQSPVNEFEQAQELPEPEAALQVNDDTGEIVPEPVISLQNEHDTQPINYIDDEVYEEIVGIENIDIQHHTHTPSAQLTNEENIAEQTMGEDAKASGVKQSDSINEETDKLIIGSIAGNDYFLFDNSVADSRTDEQAENKQPGANAQTHDVSRYNDEKMPYTFMWWLDKTRREYAATYQPYTNIQPYARQQQSIGKPENQSTADELQQQYYENIFHETSLEELEKTPKSDTPAIKRKEDIIIEKFIQEEPQIRPPAIDKLDNENKAKKSAEDRNDVVSETLANIYADQMLYHKAIAVYKKLMLKFPEKSRYFTTQIQQLENKTN